MVCFNNRYLFEIALRIFSGRYAAVGCSQNRPCKFACVSNNLRKKTFKYSRWQTIHLRNAPGCGQEKIPVLHFLEVAFRQQIFRDVHRCQNRFWQPFLLNRMIGSTPIRHAPLSVETINGEQRRFRRDVEPDIKFIHLGQRLIVKKYLRMTPWRWRLSH